MLRKADGGVLFLDEIGELGADEQAMLLRALEDRSASCRSARTRRCGATSSSSPAPTGICRAAVARGRFREDLLARINLWTFRLPGAARAARGHRRPTCAFELERAAQALKHARHDQPRGAASASCASPRSPGGALERQLPGFQRRGAAHGHAVRRAGASACATWTRSSAACARSGRTEHASRPRGERAWWTSAARRRAGRAAGPLRPGAARGRHCGSARPRARSSDAGRSAVRRLARRQAAAPTTPTGCASTWPASG